MALVKGPFDIEVGGSILGGIETLDFTYDVKEDTYDSLQGYTYTVPGAHGASFEATFLENDVRSLAVVLPQYYKANGSTLSSGEMISDPDGAIDIVPGTTGSLRDLILVSADSPLGQVMRMKNVQTEISGMEVTATVRKVKVKFTAQPTEGVALVQFFKEQAITGIS